MMPGYPFFSPFNFGRNYYNSQCNNNHSNNNMAPKAYSNKQNGNIKNELYNSFHREPQNSKALKDLNYSHDNDSENVNRYYDKFFEVFGIKLYFDDLLILALLFLLYKEDSHDDYLYIILIMLLLG